MGSHGAASSSPLFARVHPAAGRVARLAAVGACFAAAFALRIKLCPFAIVTGHPCPGCGLTRATVALLQGHVAEALHLHPLSVLISPLLAAAFAYNAVVYVREGRWAAAEGLQGRWITACSVVLMVLLLGVWIARFFGAFGGPVPV
jgi:hypothetical protein